MRMPMSLHTLLCVSLLALPSEGQTYSLSNGQATYEFTRNGSDFWLSTGTGIGGEVATFQQQPLWQLRLVGDPNVYEMAGEGEFVLDLDPSDFSAPVITETTVMSLGLHLIAATWTGTPICTKIDQDSECPDVTVLSIWALPIAGGDTLSALIDVAIGTPSMSGSTPNDTSYRLYRIDYPRLAIDTLGGSGGTDFLATGITGGILYGNPIEYLFLDPETGATKPFNFSQGVEAGLGYLIDIAGAEPGLMTVPASVYYGPGAAVCITNADVEGYTKSSVYEADAARDALLYELQQPADDGNFSKASIWDATRYQSPYLWTIAVTGGDWVDAMKRYKAERIDYINAKFNPGMTTTWNLRPAADPLNDEIPDRLKNNPFQVTSTTLNTYCPGDTLSETLIGVWDLMPGDRDTLTTAGRLQWIDDYFFPGAGSTGDLSKMPLVMLFRSVFETNLEVSASTLTGPFYTPVSTPIMMYVQALVGAMEAEGHAIMLHSVSEATSVTDSDPIGGLAPCGPSHLGCKDSSLLSVPGADFCCRHEKELREMIWQNRRWGLATVDLECGGPCDDQALPCPASLQVSTLEAPMPELCPIAQPNGAQVPVWSDWFVTLVPEIIEARSLSGGMHFNTPTISSAPCFARDYTVPQTPVDLHMHERNWGNFFFVAWKDLIRVIQGAIEADDGTKKPVVVSTESSSTSTADVIRIQNPFSVDESRDRLHATSDSANPDTYGDYWDAPIATIPMLQMVMSEVVYATQYAKPTLALPYTNVVESDAGDFTSTVSSDYFADFPAVTAGLGSWNMAKRSLAHQASILLGENPKMVTTTALLPGTAPESPEAHAVQGMFSFIRGLGFFLQAEVDLVDGNGPRFLMEYFRGSLERSPKFTILGQQEGFMIPQAVAESAFPALMVLWDAGDNGDLGDIPMWPDRTLDFEKYRPYREIAFRTNSQKAGNTFVSAAPEEVESWLPHGVYRHYDGSGNLVVLAANPWSARHMASAGQLKPLNPFTFNYASPGMSPTTDYSYSFMFEPSDYNIVANYNVFEVVFDRNGAIVEDLGGDPIIISHGAGLSGSVTLTSTTPLEGGEFAAWFITQ